MRIDRSPFTKPGCIGVVLMTVLTLAAAVSAVIFEG